MSRPEITSSDSVLFRLWGYLLERFPPVAYTVLVALFSGSAFALIETVTAVNVSLLDSFIASLVVLLVFFHLRIMDEHKDEAGDRAAYPDRLLTRGVVTLPLLAKAGVLAVLIEAVLSVILSQAAFVAWSCALIFTLLMKVEFGIGRWLNAHMVMYALTHNPIVALLAIFLWSVSGAPWVWEYGLYALVVSLGSLAFEVGRKIRLPEEEIDGVESYSSVLGRERADHFLIAIRWLTGLLLAGLAIRLGNVPVASISILLSVLTHVLLVRHTLRAKGVEGVGTVMLLLDFLLIWSLGW